MGEEFEVIYTDAELLKLIISLSQVFDDLKLAIMGLEQIVKKLKEDYFKGSES